MESQRRRGAAARSGGEDPPAEEAGAVVEGLSGQAEAHVQPKHLRLSGEEGPDQARGGGCSLAAPGQRVAVVAGRGVIQDRVGVPIRHRLPLEVASSTGAAAERRNPARHLGGATERLRVGSNSSSTLEPTTPPFLLPRQLNKLRPVYLTLNTDGVNSSSMES